MLAETPKSLDLMQQRVYQVVVRGGRGPRCFVGLLSRGSRVSSSPLNSVRAQALT